MLTCIIKVFFRKGWNILHIPITAYFTLAYYELSHNTHSCNMALPEIQYCFSQIGPGLCIFLKLYAPIQLTDYQINIFKIALHLSWAQILR